MQRNKKIFIIGLAAVVVIAGSAAGYFVIGSQREKKKVAEAVNTYTDALKKQDFSTYNGLFSEKSFTKYETSKEETIQRYETIFAGIGVREIKVDDLSTTKSEKGEYTVTYRLNLTTEFGDIVTDKYSVDLQKTDTDYSFTWSPALIFPEMRADDTISVAADEVARGEILDRNGVKLAENYDYQQVGIIPGQLGEGTEKEQNIQAISEKFGVSVEVINDRLGQAWVKDDLFVPIKTLENALSALEIGGLPSGVTIGQVNQRHYPYGEATAHLLGYVGKVSAEDIEKNPELSENEVLLQSFK